MATKKDASPAFQAASSGQAGTSVDWLDLHFEACRPEYEDMLRAAGIQPGWHMLDAGCGSGSFLPLMSELVGPDGAITAFDLDPDNIAVVEERYAASNWPSPLETQVGSLLNPLPYSDDTFDAVWCSATTQYLTDEELSHALAEFRRVVRAGGLVALKDYDACMERWRPGDPAIRWRMLDARAQQDTPLGVQVRGWFRSGILRRWLERAGFEHVWQRSVPIERWAPLDPATFTFLSQLPRFSIDAAEGLDLSESDLAYLRDHGDPTAPEHPLSDPEFHYCETHVLAVGTVPG